MPGSVPDGWRRVRLGEIAEVIGGSTPPRGDPECWNGSVPWVTPTEVTRLTGRTLAETRECITAVGVKRAGLKLLPTGTVLLTTRATIGAVARVVSPVTTNQGFQNLVPREGVDATWLYYVAQSSRPALERLAGGSTFKEVSPQSVRKLDLLLPPLSEQRAIAAVLDAVDDTIERTEAVIAATEELRCALLHELLTRGVPGMHSEWKHVSGLGTVPACWEVTTLGEVVRSVDYGTNAPLDEAFDGTPVVRMGDLTDGDVRTRSLKRANKALEPDMLITRGDILFNRTNSIDLVGKVGYVDELPGPTSFASYLLRIRVNERVNSRWLFELLNTPSSQERLQRMATKGASQANINPTSLKSLAIARPSRSEQQLVAGLIEAVREAARRDQRHLEGLQTVKTGLANGLLSGDMRIAGAVVA